MLVKSQVSFVMGKDNRGATFMEGHVRKLERDQKHNSTLTKIVSSIWESLW